METIKITAHQEEQLKYELGDLLYNNSKDGSTPEEIDLMMCNFENTVNVCEILFGGGLDIKELLKEYDPNYEKEW
ncbi:hypothetical protein [Ligilactobacillus saerimneri]|uniref:hypothetical protein n=1 Tax=Ligilactobacillus saerimneri TaxID=228229 RepID=UPI00041D2A58|nr:hypothetical protein [Ligilactobacillus saerimneri]KRL74522.1 hypothetical protein FC54_GL001355 [Ligilactobacillus saerimneri DSM 16049]